MSARDKLIRLARENTPDYGNTVPVDPETGFMFMGHDEYIAHVGKLLDEYAHELAEKVRDRYGKPRWPDEEPEYAYGYNAATHDAADLIDPVKRAP